MKQLILTIVSASYCFAYQSLTIPAGAAINLNIPNVAALTTVGDYRITFRLHNWTLPATGSVTLLQFPDAKLTLDSAGTLCGLNLTDLQNGMGNATCASVSGLSDIVGRIQRFGSTFPVTDNGPGSSWFEVWDLGSGGMPQTNCGGWNNGCELDTAYPTNAVGSTQALGASVTYSLAWLKWSTVTVPVGSPMENEETPADLADFRFEGSYANKGTAGYAITLSTKSGNPNFTASPTRPPSCNLRRQVFRAGVAAQAANYSYALDGSSLRYFWQQLSGPTLLSWSSRSSAQPTVSGAVFGSYVLQLTATDGSGQTSTCSIKDGFVAADGNGVVVTGNPSLDVLLGPQIMLGQNPWGWFDDRQVAEANLQIGNNNSPSYGGIGGTAIWNTAGPGTISVTNGSSIVNGTGTHFLSTFCSAGANGYIVVWYPNPALREGSGRRTIGVTSCQSDTQLTLSSPWNNVGALTPTIGQGGGTCGAYGTYCNWQYSSIDAATFGNFVFNAAPVDFYDAIAAFYSLYYRSGIDDYLVAARNMADNYWQIRLDSGMNYLYGEGYGWTFPRNRGVLGLVLRAIDGRPDMWTGLELIANSNITGFHSQFQSGGDWKQIGDPRENAYQLLEEAYCALFDPNASAAAGCRSGVSEVMTRGFNPARYPDGTWPVFYWQGGGGGPSSQYQSSWLTGTSVSLTNGSPYGTCVNGSGTCNWYANDQAKSPTSQFTININNVNYPQVWWFTNNPAQPPNSNADGDAIAYYPSFVDSSNIILKDTNGNTANYQGQTGLHGWVVGIGVVGFGTQPYMMGILGTAFDFAARAMTCTAAGVPLNCDNAIAATAHQYNVDVANYLRMYGYWPSTKGMYYETGFVNCQPPISDLNPGCTGMNNAGQARQLNAEALRGIMTAYSFNGDPALMAFADSLYTAMWAKAGWPTPSGQTSDGKYLSSYNDGNGWYMYGSLPGGKAQKWFGMGWGIGAGAAWPAYRGGGAHTGAIINTAIAVDLAAVPRAVTFNVLVKYPTGATSTVKCASSPCLVASDQSIGNPDIGIQYVSAQGVIVAQSGQFVIAAN